MPDLQNFAVTRGATNQLNQPAFTIAAQIVDSQSSTVLADFTGANAIQFPAVLSTLTPAQQTQIIQMVAVTIIRMKTGIQ